MRQNEDLTIQKNYTKNQTGFKTRNRPRVNEACSGKQQHHHHHHHQKVHRIVRQNEAHDGHPLLYCTILVEAVRSPRDHERHTNDHMTDIPFSCCTC